MPKQEAQEPQQAEETAAANPELEAVQQELKAAQERIAELEAAQQAPVQQRFREVIRETLAGTTLELDDTVRQVVAQIGEWARVTPNLPHEAALALMRLAEG